MNFARIYNNIIGLSMTSGCITGLYNGIKEVPRELRYFDDEGTTNSKGTLIKR